MGFDLQRHFAIQGFPGIILIPMRNHVRKVKIFFLYEIIRSDPALQSFVLGVSDSAPVSNRMIDDHPEAENNGHRALPRSRS